MTQKIERVILFLFFLLLPSQLSYHFWPPWSQVFGLRIDYLSPTLFFTDLLILSLFFLSRFKIKIPLFLIIFFAFNTLISVSPPVTLYRWLRLLEYFWLFKYLESKLSSNLRLSVWSLSLGITWTSLLAWLQFFKQASLGSLWYWLGERTFDIATPGIAKIATSGHLLLRPYATLPHPNALAGFLLVAALVVYHLNTQLKTKLRLATLSLVFAAVTIPVTFSRSTVFLELIILSLWLFHRFKVNKAIGVIFIFLLTAVSYHFLALVGSPASLPDRIVLIQKSFSIIQKYPLSGIGLGNFVSYPHQLTSSAFRLITQPVHNIYLLLASELGLPALLFLIYLLVKNLKKMITSNWVMFISILVVLATGLIDHYWLTLHQNSLLLVLLLSLIIPRLDPKP